MTPDKPNLRDQNRLLEDILDRVESIDRNVEEILNRVSDHFDETRYRRDWHDSTYGNENGHDLY